jgi:6-phosphogluconolactonase
VSDTELVVLRDPAAAAERAASLIASALARAVVERGRADWATTGGSTPIGIYQRLAVPPLRHAIPWRDVHTWWGDDRFVPADHPLSNVRPFDDILIQAGAWESVHADDHRDHGPLPIPAANVHPFPTGPAIGSGRSAAWCAERHADDLRAAGLPEDAGWPVFDLVLLGLGGDGHLLSVFPGSAAFGAPDWALAVPAPTHIEPHVERVTLNPAVIGAAHAVLVVAHGGGKAEMLRDVLGAERDPQRWPAQLARRPGATWILDEAAAALLPT